MGLFAVRDRYRLGGARRGQIGGARERSARGGGVVQGGGGWGSSGWLGREQRQRKRKERELSKQHACFWKENGLRKIFL